MKHQEKKSAYILTLRTQEELEEVGFYDSKCRQETDGSIREIDTIAGDIRAHCNKMELKFRMTVAGSLAFGFTLLAILPAGDSNNLQNEPNEVLNESLQSIFKTTQDLPCTPFEGQDVAITGDNGTLYQIDCPEMP